jgi:hypothetical protein
VTDSKPETLHLSEGEKKLVSDMRQLQRQSNKSYVVTIMVKDGIWHYWHGQPQGKVRDIDN